MQYFENNTEISTDFVSKININKELNIERFLSEFYESRYSSDISHPNYDSYSFLLLLYTKWIKFFHDEINIEVINKNHFKIKLNKGIGKDQLENFCKLFEELTLNRFYILDDDIFNEWICDLFF